MREEVLFALGSVLLVSLCSLIGIAIFSLRGRALARLVLILVSFSSGSLFGDAFLHLLPEAVNRHGFTPFISLGVLAGIAGSFFVEKVIHWRHVHSPAQVESFAYMNLLGDAVHNFLDGVLITAAYLLDFKVGVATTVAVLFHEIPQEVGDFGVLLHGGFNRSRALLYNFGTALVALLGVVLTVILAELVQVLIAFLIPFAAGTFIYIAGADLIPQLHREKGVGVSLLQLFFFMAGIGCMLVLA